MTRCASLLMLALCAASAAGQSGRSEIDEGARRLVLDRGQAIELAIRNNLELKVALLDEEIERRRIREALGAFDPVFFVDGGGGTNELLAAANFPLDPTDPTSPTVSRILAERSDQGNASLGVRGLLDTGLTYDLTFASNYSYLQTGGSINPVFTNTASIGITQPLLRGAWSAYQNAPVQSARIRTLSAHQGYRDTVRSTISDTQRAYYDLVFAIEQLKVARRSLELARRQVEITRVKVETGALPRIEMTSAESGRAGRQAAVVSAEATVIENEDRLRRLILAFDDPADWDTRIIPSEHAEEFYVEIRALDEILRLAERSEPELLRAHLAVADAEVEVLQRRSESLPRLDLTANARTTGLADDFSNAASSSFFGEEGAVSWSLGLSFETPLGNRVASARLAESELRARRARMQLQDTRISVTFEVRSTLRDIDVARRDIAARNEAVRLAEEQLGNERLRLELGTTTNFQVFQVEDELNQRQIDLIRSLLDYRLAVYDLVRVSGVPLRELLVARDP